MAEQLATRYSVPNCYANYTHMLEQERPDVALESCVGDLLERLGYELASPRSARQFLWVRTLYPTLFAVKNWLKQHTSAGRFASIDRMRAA